MWMVRAEEGGRLFEQFKDDGIVALGLPIASQDGFGFENPRIVVEVKHRSKTAMGAQEIRIFLGGRHNVY